VAAFALRSLPTDAAQSQAGLSRGETTLARPDPEGDIRVDVKPVAGAAPEVRRVVVKVGGSVLTDATGRLVPERLDDLATQLAACAAEGREPVLVSSGAIACGMAALGLSRRPREVDRLQACAAVGQGELMQLYVQAFRAHGRTVAQVLLTQQDLADRARRSNAKRTLLMLMARGVIPIVNENDTVASEGKTFGDNDRLAALVASAVEAQLLIILTDVEGFLKEGRVVERVHELEDTHAAVYQARRSTTKGGMASKLEAARIAGHHGIPLVIARGTRPCVLSDILSGAPVGTWFVPPSRRLASSKWWIAFSLATAEGELVVDTGAAEALVHGNRSLLAAGLREVRGDFSAGAVVSIVDEAGTELARGVSNFSSSDLTRVRGMKTDEAARALGHEVREIVHRNRLVLGRELGR
jgi:glutamate 5-kinase